MKNWLITGVSSGLGRALAQEVLAAGDKVVGTVRNEKDLAAFEALDPERAIGQIMDVTQTEKVPALIAEAEARAGDIDILVNNAGYALVGAVEEMSIEELQSVFNVNFFGAVACIKAVVPRFRERRSGRIINITSVSGLAPWAGTAAYGASKYALEGLGQTLAQEMAEFSVFVTNVEPGSVKTDFGSRSLKTAENEVAAYQGTVTHVPKEVFADNNHGGADARKAARAIVEIANVETPPVHLLLGEDAVFYVGQQMNTFMKDMTKWMPLTMSINR